MHLPERPFRSIQQGTKKVEGRVPKNKDNEYQKMQPGDILIFKQPETSEELTTEIIFIHHYPDFKTMLETEGVENVLSSQPKTIKHGIESYNSLDGYRQNVIKYGVYAIGIRPVKQN